MFSDLMSSVLYLGGFMTLIDILGKINTQKIKNMNDLQMDLTFKAFFIVNMFNKTSIMVEKGLNTVYNCINNKKNSNNEEENVLWIKIDTFKDGRVEKELISYNYDQDYNLCDIEYKSSNCDSESDSDNESENESDNESDNDEESFKFAYDYITKSYINIEKKETLNKEKCVRHVLNAIDNSLYDTKIFLNIELINNEEKHDITKYLSNYYRSSNKILSCEFLKYLIIDNDLSIELSDNYTINIMDKNVDMITLNNSQYVEFYIKTSEEASDELCYKIINLKN